MIPRRFSIAIAAITACVGLGSAASIASGSYHLNKIREISGSTGGTNSAYIELQMYAAGENLVSGHNITLWDADGLVLGMPIPIQTLPLTGPNPPSGQNQRAILIGDTGVAGRDFTLDLTPYIETGGGGGNNLIAAGAACYEGIPVDCFSWGAFTGAANLPDKATPFGQPMSTTFALRRKITSGCSTLLEASDDTNNNQSDFEPVQRAPRNNATSPTEQSCEKAGVGGAPGLRCRGKLATLRGTASNDVLTGTAQRDVIVAGAGNDTVKGLGGNDLICGEADKDVLRGGPGKDLLAGGAGADLLSGGARKDKLLGQAGKDVCRGGAAADRARTCETKKTI